LRKTAELSPSEPVDRFLRTAGRPVVRRGRVVDRFDERLVRASARIGARLEQVVEPLVAEPLDLPFREGGMEDHLGEQLEGGLQPVPRDVDARGQRVPAGLGMERGAKPFRGLGQLDGVIALRALGQGSRCEHRGAAHVVGLVDRAVAQDQRAGDERAARHVRDEDSKAVRQPVLVDRREVVRARGAGCGTLGQGHGGLRAHAATSSSSVASSGAASLSAAGPSGRYVSTSRFSGTNTFDAMSRMSCGVTAR